jgi:mRNA interferase MazF
MVMKEYIPDRGDLVWLEFTPQSGNEQAGIRPGLVISPVQYNKVSGLCVVFPITSKIKGYPFEVKIDTLLVNGVVLADQVKTLDWKSRNAQYICKADPNAVMEVINLFSTLLT